MRPWTGPKKTFAIKFTFPLIKSEEINGSTQKLCQKDFILKVARDFVHRFYKLEWKKPLHNVF